MKELETVKSLLARIYGEEKGGRALNRIIPLIQRVPRRPRADKAFFSAADVVLITYADTLRRSGEPPLATLSDFAAHYLKGVFSTVHFLPFFPYSSDDGFSVKDFHTIDPDHGTWDQVTAMGEDFGLMFDFVVNHFSAKGQWFQNYLAGRDGFRDFAIEVDPAEDLSRVTRPRSLPLLSEYRKTDGRPVHLWTTFSADQIDFNFKSIDVLEKMIAVLLLYVAKGATILRMDAIAYLWKEIGTPCIHLPRTHDMVKLFRAVLDVAAPDVMIITETNVPHAENISYFGDGKDEAQMVYNFTLPPLLLHAFVKGDARVLSNWAETLKLPSNATAFYNFTASHDGIGVRPLEGILPDAEVAALARAVRAGGGQVSTRRRADGSDSPYELNVTYVDAILGDPQSGRSEKFLASQAIQYALPGVPATYIHSLLGSRNWLAGVGETGRARTINREKLDLETVEAELNDTGSFRSKVFYPYLHLIKTRIRQPAFHPNASFAILHPDPKVFAVRREAEAQIIYALTNVCGEKVSLKRADLGFSGPARELLTGQVLDTPSIDLKPYQTVWLSTKSA